MIKTINLGLYNDLLIENGPKHLIEALKTFGTLESAGSANNKTILAWADEVNETAQTAYARWAEKWYDKDSTPWCGLWVAVIMVRAARLPVVKYLSALEWLNWGKKTNEPMLGDVLVFNRQGGGHVGLYVGEDKDCYHVLGGNQGDRVSIIRILKSRLTGARRPNYINQPDNVKVIIRNANGPVSNNEA